MKIGTQECTWYKEKPNGDEIPPARSQHLAVGMPGNDRIFVFGGHNSQQIRLNDSWILTVNNLSWKRTEGSDPSTPKNQESANGGPSPRANTAGFLMDGKIYVFGGHGGVNYARRAFNDLYTFDCETHQWEQLTYENTAPEPRGGHSIFGFDNKIYVYGGWNSENQYNNVIVFDCETKMWSDPDIYNEIPRWNHCAVMVEAIPSWKYFIFGGEKGDFPEGGPRHFGTCCNGAYYLDLATMHWLNIDPENKEEEGFVQPSAREYAAMAYDHKDSRLLVFGGWNNGFFEDLYALQVSKIVGPSYAVTEVDPPLGQLSGNVPITIKGCGFKDASIKVYFTCGKTPVDVPSKMSVEATGNFVSETEITCLTPNFDQFGPKEAIV